MKNLFNTHAMKLNTIASSKKWLTAAVIAVGFSCLYQPAKAQSTEGNVVVSAPTNLDKDDAASKTNADFPGGIDKFYTYVASKLTPDSTCSPGKRVYVMFTIDKEGNIKRVKVQGHVLSNKMNDQLAKIFESAPQWIPAKQNGNEVREHFVCPVSFMPKADLMAKADLPKLNK